MRKTHLLHLATAALIGLAFFSQAQADDVTKGLVIRGVTLTGAGAPGTQTGKQCDFKDEPVNQNRMTGASVNCKQGITNLNTVLAGLPARFNAYCVSNAPIKSAKLMKAPLKDNANHCDLSGITAADATSQFKGALWR